MSLSNLQKAAVFLASLPRSQADRLLGQLTPEELESVRSEMTALRKIDPSAQEAVLQEFSQAENQTDKPTEWLPSNPRVYRRFDGAHPWHATDDNTPFSFLFRFDPSDLLSLFEDEQPQTLAVIFSYLPSQLAADTLALMPPDEQTAVIGRMAAMNTPSEEVVRTVAEAVRRRIYGDVPAQTPHSMSSGVSHVVRMLNVMVPAAERRLLNDLAASDPDLHQRIRRVMFGEDVAACGDWDAAGKAC